MFCVCDYSDVREVFENNHLSFRHALSGQCTHNTQNPTRYSYHATSYLLPPYSTRYSMSCLPSTCTA